MTDDKRKPAEDEAAKPPRGDTLEDASEEAVADIEKRRGGTGHAGTGDIG